MAEHKVWAIVDKRHGTLKHVAIDQNPIGDSLVTRCVEATLTIPDEPEWVAHLFEDGGFQVRSCDGRVPRISWQGKVRAPDAQTALALALAERNGG